MTPDNIFAPLHAMHKFTVDACAEGWNTKLDRYWSPWEDGLKQSWMGERIWCNPPYGRGMIQPWVDKALSEQYGYCKDGPAGCATLLLPSRTDTVWFHQLYARHIRGWATIKFLPKRIHFLPPPGIKASSPTEASIIVRIWA